MLAFTVRNKKLVARNKPLPQLRPRWALVRVLLAGICNTDVEILRGYHAFRGVPGHEFVGEVAAVNGLSAKEKTKWLGKRVAGEINVSCSAYNYRPICAFCRRGLKTVVKEITLVGSRCGPFAKAIALLRCGKVDLRPLITRTFPLSEAPAAIKYAQQPGVMKVLIRPE
jgi:threonine dehydrogenase-like Zn-dependent dehydrogenase